MTARSGGARPLMRPLRVACFTPLPPQRTGIADYCASLLPSLANGCALEIFTEDATAARASLAGTPVHSHLEFEARARRGSFDGILYHMGNNARFHAFMYPHLLHHRGVTVLHDLSLLQFYARLHSGPGGARALLEEVEHCEGARGRVEFFAMLRPGAMRDGLRVPLLRRVIETSRALIVHSGWAREWVGERWPASTVHQIPHGVWTTEEGEGLPVRRALQWDDRAAVFGTVGLVDQPERTGLLLRAFARVFQREPLVRLLIVGLEPENLVTECRTLVEQLPRGVVVLVGYIPPERVGRYVAACDVVVRLRYPSVGETSGVIARALGAGRPVVTTDAPQLREIGREHCIRVPPGAGEEDSLVELLARLAADPAERRSRGESARQSVRGLTWESAATRYLEVLETARRV